MGYETQYGESIYRYVDDGNFVTIYVNGKFWGSPQGDRFFKALLKDIEELNLKIEELQDEIRLHRSNYDDEYFDEKEDC